MADVFEHSHWLSCPIYFGEELFVLLPQKYVLLKVRVRVTELKYVVL